jgi:hypothetical protein
MAWTRLPQVVLLVGLLGLGFGLEGGPAAPPASADGSWLDAPLVNWNRPGMAVPTAPPMPATIDPRCLGQLRPPETAEDQALAAAGWQLYGSYQAGWGIRAIKALSGFDGMCRPVDHQEFVFVDGALAGTISPGLMSSRTDGVGQVEWLGERIVTASYRRYQPSDPLCCPSGQSSVSFRVDRGSAGPLLVPERVTTTPTSQAPQVQTRQQITIEDPTADQALGSPIRVRGRTTLYPFEGTLGYRLFGPQGELLARGPFMVQGDYGQPGTFEFDLTFPPDASGPARLEIVELSAKDGSVLAIGSVAFLINPRAAG